MPPQKASNVIFICLKVYKGKIANGQIAAIKRAQQGSIRGRWVCCHSHRGNRYVRGRGRRGVRNVRGRIVWGDRQAHGRRAGRCCRCVTSLGRHQQPRYKGRRGLRWPRLHRPRSRWGRLTQRSSSHACHAMQHTIGGVCTRVREAACQLTTSSMGRHWYYFY